MYIHGPIWDNANIGLNPHIIIMTYKVPRPQPPQAGISLVGECPPQGSSPERSRHLRIDPVLPRLDVYSFPLAALSW